MRNGSSNLTHGGRTLRIEGRLNKEHLKEDLLYVVQNFAHDVRYDIMKKSAKFMITRMRQYISIGKKEAKTPSPASHTYNMQRDLPILVKWSGIDTITIDLSRIPYAALHNKPLGTTTLIGRGKLMKFIWYRMGKKWVSTRKGIRKPGIAFASRAVEDTRGMIPTFLHDSVAKHRRAGQNINPVSGAHYRGNANSPKNRVKYMQGL